MCDDPSVSSLLGLNPASPLEDFANNPSINAQNQGGNLASSLGGLVTGGFGGLLGTLAGIGLAPLTGGLSLGIPIATGALGGIGGNLLGDAAQGTSVNPLGLAEGGVLGGIGGGLGAGFLGGAAPGASAAGDFGFADASGAFGGLGGAAAPTFGEFAGDAAAGAAGGAGDFGFGDLSGAFGGGVDATPGGGLSASVGTAAPGSGVAAAAPAASGLGGGGSPAAGATAQSVSTPFDTGIGAGGAPGTPGADLGPFEGTSTGSITATPATFGQATTGPTVGTGGSPGVATPGTATPNPADVFTAPTAPGDILGDGINLPTGASGDFSFANESGAFGGLGNNPVPTTGDFSGGLGGTLSDISNFIKDNRQLLGLGLGVGGLGRQLLQSGQQSPATAQLQQLQQQLMQQIQALQGGQLTPAQQQQFQNNLNATLAKIRSTYGALGQGRSTSEMEDEAAASAASTGAQAQAVSSNLSTALQAAGLPANISSQLLQQEMSQDAALSQAISRLAAAALS